MKSFAVATCAISVLLMAAGVVFAQSPDSGWGQSGNPHQNSGGVHRPGPDQPIVPQVPTIKKRQPPAARAPFTLTPQQQAYVDQVLNAWERSSSQVKTFDCRFVRWKHNKVFGGVQKVDGEIKYAAPDKGLLRVDLMEKDGKMIKVDQANTEHWVCDGKSIFTYDPIKKQLIEHQLPPELQGKSISDGPLPFLFGAKAADMKARYYIRAIMPPEDAKDQIWLEAYPRNRADAANFNRAELILTASSMQPFALQLHEPNGKTKHAYSFYKINVNATNPLQFLQGNPFSPKVPLGWKKVVNPAPTAQAERGADPAAGGQLR